ncbi:Lipase maturation factor [Paragonimus heterotremus]|uniref:Lipase maturation factor n=1 Tax=Paragonimus heterotremus TaxID=100268 RepID=A0A8J4SZ73_9TREM|nr:Lipase maturation factor [Paragonimus heterotremus]
MGRLNVTLPKHRFLLFLSFIYLFSFTSLYIQLPGLYGENGILPVNLLRLTTPTNLQDFVQEPNLLRFSSIFKLDVIFMFELCVVVGAVLAFLAAWFSEFRNSFVFSILWLTYFSVFKGGQTFLWFQWDILLLEAGFIAILLSSLPLTSSRYVASDRIALWLLRWLLFRLMFSAGVVKLTSECPSWWDLKALHWHYQSQCIPNPLSWYAHHLPGWFHQLGVASTLAIEIIFPLLFFVPLRGVRLFSFYAQVFLQTLIILTGNFNFFNLLIIALCYSLLKNEDFRPRNRYGTNTLDLLSDLCSCILIVSVLLISGYLFNLRIMPDFTVSSSIGFSKNQFYWLLSEILPHISYIGVALYFVELFLSFVCALRARKGFRRFHELLGVGVVGLIGITLLFGSLVPFSTLDDKSVNKLPAGTRRIYQQLKPYQLTNSYGLFRRMTGVGGRPEVILEGALHEDGPWTEYHFRFKPGRVNRIPPVVMPHQPRLDWQLWFAALSRPDNHPWFYNLVYRLLQQERDGHQSGNWWRRVKKSDYLPPVSLSSSLLQSAVEHSGLIGKRRHRPMDPTPLSLFLIRMRTLIGQPPDLTPLLLVCLILWITKRASSNASATAARTAGDR